MLHKTQTDTVVEQVLVDEEDIRLLNEVGFTRSQARVYLTLLKIGETDARTLFKKANITQPEVYRALDELQRKGLVEKEISVPLKFTATPIHFGLQMLMQTIKNAHGNAQRSVDIISTLQRWSIILDCCFENYVTALERKVRYRVIINKPLGKIMFQENIQTLLAKPYFELRLSKNPLKTNAAVFDEKEATINFFEGKPLKESPIIWTNHPGLIQMCQDHFDKVWKSAEKYTI